MSAFSFLFSDRSSLTSRPTGEFKRRLLVTCLGLAAPLSLLALDPKKSIYQYNCQNWNRFVGLPADKVNTIAQSPDGYLWFGTQNGLIRFDGQEFKTVAVNLPAARGNDIHWISPATDGRMLFAINQGGVGGFDGKNFSIAADPRWTSITVDTSSILATRDGTVWHGTIFGWSRWVKDDPAKTVFEAKTAGAVIMLSEDATGRVWIGTAQSGLYYRDQDELKLFPDEELKKQNVGAVTQDSAGDIWVATFRGLYRYDSEFRRKEIFFRDTKVGPLLVDRHGVLWVGTDDFGLARFTDGKFSTLQKIDGLGSDSVTSLLEDAEGSLWVGTMEGLSQLTDVKFPILSAKEGLVPGSGVAVARSPRGGVWVALSNGASYIDAHGGVKNYTTAGLFSNRYARRVFESKNGDIYFGDGDRNISIMTADGSFTRYPNESLWPEAFVEDETGIVAGIGTGLYRFQNKRFEPYHYIEQEPPDLDWINQLCLAKDGAIWIASNNGLFRVKDGHWRRWSMADGLPINRVHFVMEDVDGSIWAGLPAGIACLKDERITSVTHEHGLSDDRIFAIVPDDLGFFWMSSGRGIMRVSRESLTRFVEGNASTVDSQLYDGLESVKFNDRTDQGYSGCKTADGRIWFPNPRGVVMIDPEKYVSNEIPPRVTLDKVRMGNSELDEANRAAPSRAHRNIEFFFTALSFIAPHKVHVRYQLEGFDPNWRDADAHRSVLYNNLEPGHYTFRVQAANADGVWNTTGASYSLNLPPPYYRRLWFYLLCAGGGSLSLVGGYRWKVSHMRAAQRKLESQNDLLESKVHQRTNELARSLSLLKATLDSTADGILAVQLSDGAVTYNSRFAEMWRIPEEKIGKISGDELRVFAADQTKHPAAFIDRGEKLFARPEEEKFDLVELKDGRFFERYSKPQRIEGKSIGVVINYRDITQRRRAETAVAEASALLDSLLNNTLDMMYFKDRESRFVRYSANLVQRHGLQHPDALRGKSDFDLFPENVARVYFNEEQEIIRTGRPLEVLNQRVTAGGKPVWIMTVKMPWRDHAGETIGTFGIARDVSALKETEIGLSNERDLLNGLLDSSPDKIYFKDRASRFTKCSRALVEERSIGSTDAILGKTDFDLFAREHAQAAFDDEQEIMRTGKPLIGKVERETHLDGHITWVLTSKMPLRNNQNEIIGTVGVSKDITPLKEAEEKLVQVHQQLLETSRQAGMAEVATSVLHNVGNVLNSVNVSATLVADQIRSSKTHFVPKTGALLQSHLQDLATFLTSDPKGSRIPTYLSTLGEELLAEQRAMTEELGHLQKNIEHIKEIVSMQQSFAKVSGVIESIPLTEIVDDALRINASSLTRHDVELVRDYQFKPTLTVDRHKLMQILVNLVRNAKHACDDAGRPDKKIVLRITRHDQRLRIEVIDNGVGIPTENLTRIFAHGFTTRKEGHGFGLHSGALVARELGGALMAHSDGPGRGATFTLELPLAPHSSQS